jgi:hypothetical protein
VVRLAVRVVAHPWLGAYQCNHLAVLGLQVRVLLVVTRLGMGISKAAQAVAARQQWGLTAQVSLRREVQVSQVPLQVHL